MDLERLSADEVRQLSKIFQILGIPAAPDELESRVNVCEGAASIYRKELDKARASSRAHGD